MRWEKEGPKKQRKEHWPNHQGREAASEGEPSNSADQARVPSWSVLPRLGSVKRRASKEAADTDAWSGLRTGPVRTWPLPSSCCRGGCTSRSRPARSWAPTQHMLLQLRIQEVNHRATQSKGCRRLLDTAHEESRPGKPRPGRARSTSVPLCARKSPGAPVGALSPGQAAFLLGQEEMEWVLC